jgi:peroxiredoxin
LPPVQKVYQELKGKGFEVLLISFRESPETVKQAVQDRKYVTPVLLDASGDVTGKVYGVWGPPTVYILDRQGRLVGRAAGPRAWDSPAGRRLLQALLEAPATP